MNMEERAAHGVPARGRTPAGAWLALATLLLATLLAALDAALLRLLAEPVRHSLGLSDTQLGLLQGMGMTLFAGIATLPIGWLADRYDRRLVLAGCVLLWSAATALRGVAQDFETMFVASMGLGIGEAGLAPVVYSLIPDLFPRHRRVLATSIYVIFSLFGAGLGMAIGGSLVPLLEGTRSALPAALQGMEAWRLTCLAVAVPGPLVAGLVLTIRWRLGTGMAAAVVPGANAPRDDLQAHVRAHWRVLAGVVCGVGISSMGLSALGGWLPVLAARQYGATPERVGQGMGLAILGGTLAGALLGGLLLRLLRHRLGESAPLRAIMLGQLAAAALSLLLLAIRSASDIYLLMGVMLTPLIATSMLAPTVMQDLSPAHLRARLISLITVALLPFSALSPVLVGLVSDQGSRLGPAILAITLASVVTGAASLRLSEAGFARVLRATRATG